MTSDDIPVGDAAWTCDRCDDTMSPKFRRSHTAICERFGPTTQAERDATVAAAVTLGHLLDATRADLAAARARIAAVEALCDEWEQKDAYRWPSLVRAALSSEVRSS